MGTTNRRDFMKHLALSGTATGLGISTAVCFPRRIFSEETGKSPTIAYRMLGSTGYKVSEIGFGAMNTRDSELIHAAIDTGINYLDTAHRYMRGVNEEIIGKVMNTKRDKVFLTTKIPMDDPEDMIKMIETSLKRLRTDHIDLLLLHSTSKKKHLQNGDYQKVFDAARKKGYIRFVGVSTHSNQAEVLDAAVESKFWEAVLVSYNYLSFKRVRQSIEKARKAGIAIIAMKTQRRGTGFPFHDMGDITYNQAALKWVLNDPCVDTTIPGMTTFGQLEEDLQVMEMKMTFDDTRILRHYTENLKGYYCYGVSGCTGCKDKCPKGVEINEINRCLGYAYGYGDIELAHDNYRVLPRLNRIDICAECDECTVRCVNDLNLTENIQRARELFT